MSNMTSNRKMSYGVMPGRRLASLYGDTAMQPMSSARPRSNAALPASSFQPISDVLNSAQVANKQRLASIMSGSATQPASATPAPMPPTATPTTPVSPAPSATVQGTDLSADPILNQIQAIGRRSVSDAATSGLASAKNDLVNFGSLQVPQTLRDLFATETPTNDALLGDLPANPVLGALNDAGTGQAAAGNPFSTTAQLDNAHTTNIHNLDQTANNANLYYSSTLANQLGDENTAHLGAEHAALQALAQALSGDNMGVLDALNHAHDAYVAELPNAYARAIAAGGSGDTTTPPSTDGGFNRDPSTLSPQDYLALRGLSVGAKKMNAV
jgi:hypothetical protein